MIKSLPYRFFVSRLLKAGERMEKEVYGSAHSRDVQVLYISLPNYTTTRVCISNCASSSSLAGTLPMRKIIKECVPAP